MRRLRVAFRREARIDLENIHNSVLKISQNKATAYGFYRRILDRCAKIGNVPYGGRRRDDLIPGLHIVAFEHSAVIAYVVEFDCVRIVNVFYGGRDYEGFYLGSDDRDESDELPPSN
jgi:toxin ParE1/3/4